LKENLAMLADSVPPVLMAKSGSTGPWSGCTVIAALFFSRSHRTMRDLKSRTSIWAKGILFLLLGVGAAVILLAEAGTPKVALLLVVAVWAFCRAYYFAFYVIEKYVDPSYRSSGLISFARYWCRQRKPSGDKPR
jgi:hypothetical protein